MQLNSIKPKFNKKWVNSCFTMIKITRGFFLAFCSGGVSQYSLPNFQGFTPGKLVSLAGDLKIFLCAHFIKAPTYLVEIVS